MAAEAINKDADELLNIAVEKLLSIARVLSYDARATSVNHQREFGVESERVLSEELFPKAVEASNDEGARSSIAQQQLPIQKSEVPLFAGYDNIVPGMLVTNAIQGLLYGIDRSGTSKVDAISRGVFNVAEALAVRSGKEEDIVMYLEQVLEYLETTPELAGTLLHCHILYRFANVFKHRGLMENAKRALYSAQRIAAGSSDMAHLEIAISASLMSIHKELGEDHLLHIARVTFIQICEARLMPVDGTEYTSVLGGVGRTKFELGLASSDMEQMGDGINYMTEALRVDADQEINETPRQAMRQASLLLNLSECYYQHPELSTGQLACLILLDQAIAGFQQVECACGPDSKDPLASNWGGSGVLECGRHQKLADAFKSLGIVQENQGFMEEAQKSFERGLDLVEECNDVGRIVEFRLVLAVNLFLRSHLNFAFGLPRLEEAPELTKFYYKHIVDHFTEFLKKTRPGASFERDQLAIYARVLLNPPEDLSEGTLEKVMALRKILENAEERGSRSGHAFFHQCLSVHYLRLNDAEACKHHLSLALKSLEETPSTTETSLLVLQPLGWIAMDPEIQEFDCAYGIWQKVYRATAETLENLAQISEEHAFRYFEISKHACVALAKCQMYRARFLNENNKQQLEEGALVWAERGKGRMLMSFIDASTRSNADPASHFDKGRFLTDDTFARKFICNWLPISPPLIMPQARKTVFVEYTLIDYMSLMIQIVIDDPGSVGTLHHSEIISLQDILGEATRHEAETFLNAVHDSSEAMQNSANTVTFQGEIQNVLSAMNKYSTNRIPFNPWIPGMVVGIQKHIGEAIAKLSRSQKSLVDKEMNKIAELLQALYAVLIKPIKEELAAVYEKGRDTLVFVPHEDLGIVPFAALHEYSEESPHYLIEDYAISVSPSIWCSRHCQYLYEKIVREEGAVPVLVGKKSGYPPEYPDLRQAHKEVDAVAEAIGQSSSSTMVLKDDDLSHTRNLMEVLPNASWIHLCVHGEVSSQFPQGSLLFCDDDNQRLTAEEIMTVAPSAWRARAVVLSACQTGLGSVAGGGIMGFARSFILAGVPSSVLSMWQAEDRFSTEFMQNLYKQLASGYTLAYAVQVVIKSMMHEYKKGRRKYGDLKWSIYQWACFSCLGFPSVVLPNTELRQL